MRATVPSSRDSDAGHSLKTFVADFADALRAADSRRPVHKTYSPGIGSFSEDRAVGLAVPELVRKSGTRYPVIRQGVRYPESQQRCDLGIGQPLVWAIEIKIARFFGNNNKPDDQSIKDLLSPYPFHRSALTDTVKLGESKFSCRRAVLIYGFDHPKAPLLEAIEAFEVLAQRRVNLGKRHEASLGKLVHPVHAAGSVFAWEVLGCLKPPRSPG
jgi:hypothetical protein